MVKINMKKNLHQIWDNGILPDKYKINQQSLIDNHKDWNYKLWNIDECRELIKEKYNYFLDTFDNYEYKIQRIDASKFFILDAYNGLYCDTDIFFFKNIETLINNENILLLKESDSFYKGEEFITNSIFYNNNSTFFNKLCKQIKYFNLIDRNNRIAQNQWQTDIINVLTKAGPILLSNFYKANNFNFEIKSCLFFEKYRKKEEGKDDNTIYGVHEYSNSWFDKDKVLL